MNKTKKGSAGINLYGLKMLPPYYWIAKRMIPVVNNFFKSLEALKNSKGSQQVLREQREKFRASEAGQVATPSVLQVSQSPIETSEKKVVIFKRS